MPLDSATAGMIVGGVGSAGNLLSTLLTNKSNQELNQAMMDYNTKMTQQQWERDDTAHQREVADLEKAGLSPLAALGGLSSTSPLGSPNQIPNQAPQFDSSAFVQSAITKSNNELRQQEINEIVRHNTKSESQTDMSLFYEGQQIVQNAQKLNLEDKKINHQIIQDSRMYELEDKQLNEIMRHNKNIEDLEKNEQDLKRISTISENFYKYVQTQTGGKQVPIKVYRKNELQDYLSYRTIRLRAYNGELEKFDNAKESTSASGSVGINKNKNGGWFSRGEGLNHGNSLGLNVSGSGSYSRDSTFNYDKQIESFNNQWPFPIYWPYDDLPHELYEKEKK